MIRLYISHPFERGQDLSLPDSQSHYLQKVMRLGIGAEILIFNGAQGEWLAKIKIAHKKSTTLELLSQTRPPQTEGDLWLLFSPLKPKRQEFLVEKATELGVSCLWPVGCERTSSSLKEEKIRAHGIEAAEQSRRLTVPTLKSLLPLRELLRNWPQERLLLFGDESLSAPPLLSVPLDLSRPYGILIGPEGGFSRSELEALHAHPQAQGVTLSPHILRSETAAVVGVALLQVRLSADPA